MFACVKVIDTLKSFGLSVNDSEVIPEIDVVFICVLEAVVLVPVLRLIVLDFGFDVYSTFCVIKVPGE